VLHTLETKQLKPELSTPLTKLVLLICFLVIIYFGYERYERHKTEQAEASVLTLNPQVNDIYFLDMRLLNDKLERKNKYKLAKIVRVTDDNVAIVFGRIFYQWQYAVVNSIQYGDLSNSNYFRVIPDYISFNKIKEMKSTGAIYLVKRPMQNKIYNNFVSPE
jgi:cbb3-type cytochrome oxidase subunit 3